MALAPFALRPVGKNRRRIGGVPVKRLAAVPIFFLFRVAAGVLLLKLSASTLPVSGFTAFSQFMLLAALLNTVAVGGVQNGLIRQAAAAHDKDVLARAHGAALTIWAIAAPVLMLAIVLGSSRISHILIGENTAWRAVSAIGLLVLAAGPGQIWCSILTGRKRVPGSLLAQAAGLAASTSAAVWLILRGDPLAAAVGFACGPLVTMAVAGLFFLRLRLPSPRAASWDREIKVLLGYSAAFAATACYASITLFLLRWFYREQFDATQLGYWLAANRVSDMSTQLIGLFLIQFFVPHFAALVEEKARRVLMLRCWAVGVAVMGAIPLVFSLAAEPLVHLFLSDAYLPAIPAIRIFMVGDLFRVWTLLAMYSAFARGQPIRYALVEMGAFTLLGVLTLLLIGTAGAEGPLLAYATTFAVMAVATSAVFALRRPADRKAPRTAR